MAHTETVDEDGYKTKSWANVFGAGVSINCQWVNAHGQEALQAHQLGLKEVATLTMRYTEKLRPTCRILRSDDPAHYEVISVDNIREAGRFLEVKVHRGVEAT